MPCRMGGILVQQCTNCTNNSSDSDIQYVRLKTKQNKTKNYFYYALWQVSILTVTNSVTSSMLYLAIGTSLSKSVNVTIYIYNTGREELIQTMRQQVLLPTYNNVSSETLGVYV